MFFPPFTGNLPPLPKVQCANFLDFRNPWGKIMDRSGPRFENFAHKGCKIAAAEFIFTDFFLICSLYLNVFLPQIRKVQCPNFLGFQNPRGKIMEGNGLRFENFSS